MDIFNRERVQKLEERLDETERKNAELQRLLDKAELELSSVLELKKTIPEDCVPGEYCEACEFAKRYSYHGYGYRSYRLPFGNITGTVITGIVCGKGTSCANFIQKEIKNDTTGS